MKEYLTMSNSGKYKLVNHRFTDVDIEVPEGADILLEFPDKDKIFYSKDFYELYSNRFEVWQECWYESIEDAKKDMAVILWKRDSSEENTQDYDIVNKPKHYNSDPSGVQCIELTRCLSFDAGNALKYVFREGNKDASLQELKKAQWYVNDLIEYDVPIAIDGLGDTIEFEDKVKKVLSTWSGWKYIFLNALYWNDKQEMKRAIDALVKEAETDK